MHCANCQKTIEAPESGAAPAPCPHFGTPLSGDPAARRRPFRHSARRGVSSVLIILVLLVVVLAAAGIGSTIYAMRAIEERDQARENFAASSGAMSEILVAAASSGKLRGAAAAEDRESILKPALAYYQELAKTSSDDPQKLPQFASAQFHAAALQAKLGDEACVNTLKSGLTGVNQMATSGDFEPESYPDFQNSVLRLAAPTEWFTLRAENPMAYRIGLFAAIQNAVGMYRDLAKQYPAAVGIRDDFAELLKSNAMIFTAINQRGQALSAWHEARGTLETLVRDEPSNSDYQARLAESLVNAARLERNSGETDKAIANFQRALEIRQKLAEADPEDKSLAQAVTVVQRDLERARSAPPPEKKAAQDTPKQAQATPQKAAKDESSKADAGKPAPKQASAEEPSAP